MTLKTLPVAILIATAGCTHQTAAAPSAVPVLYRFEHAPQSNAARGTDPRVDPFPDRRRQECDPGRPTGWIPVHGQGIAGIDLRRLGVLDRADGTRQLTVDGCPIYRKAGTPPTRTSEGLWTPVV